MTEHGRGYGRRAAGRLLTGVRVRDARRSRSLAVSFRLAQRGGVTIAISRAGRRVRTMRLNALARGRHAISLDDLPRGLYRVEIRAAAGERRHVLQRAARRR